MTQLMIRLRWCILGWFDTQIQTMITERLLKYHRQLVNDGFIPELKPPYQKHQPGITKEQADAAVRGLALLLEIPMDQIRELANKTSPKDAP